MSVVREQDLSTPEVKKLAEGLYARVAIDNMGWADMGGYRLVVDALEQPDEEESVFRAMEETVGTEQVRYLINTHLHGDHTVLNDAFRERLDTEIVNYRQSDIPEDGRWFRGEKRRALVLPLGGCHTPNDCAVWFPEDSVLFAGDLFGWGLIPVSGNLREPNRQRLLSVVDRMIELQPRIVVPGHGPLCGGRELARWRRYFTALVADVKDACARGLSDDQIREQLPPPEDMADWWRFRQWKHDDSLRKVIKAVRRGFLS
mgnify:CR=1 FL=1